MMRHRQSWFIGLLVALSWLGLVIHNYVESVDGSTIAVGAVGMGLFIAWLRIPLRRVLIARLLIILGLVQAVGAAVTVLPFTFLPFVPSQSVTHYIAHVLYGGFQLPLVGVMVRLSRRAGG